MIKRRIVFVVALVVLSLSSGCAEDQYTRTRDLELFFEKAEPGDAAALYRRASDQGHPQANFRVGWKLWLWYEVPQDRRRATELMRKAADDGYLPAQMALGLFIYQKAPADYVQAHLWLDLLVSNVIDLHVPDGGVPSDLADDLYEVLDDAVKERDRIARYLMTREQVAEAQRLAEEWWQAKGHTEKFRSRTVTARGEAWWRDPIEGCGSLLLICLLFYLVGKAWKRWGRGVQ